MFNVRSLLIKVAIAGALTALLPGMACAQASLSERISQLLKDAQKAETLRLYDRAIELYQNALKDDTIDGDKRRELLRLRAQLYERIEEVGKAEADLTAALKSEPVDPKLYGERGYFYLRQGRYPDALADFVSGTRLDPKNPLFSFGAGRAMVALRNDRGAIALYNDAIALSPKEGGPFIARAEAFVRMKMFAKAIADYDRAAKLHLKNRNDWFFIHLGRGYAQLQVEQYEGAARDLDEALDIMPNDRQTLVWRGFAREKLGDRDHALDDYEQAYRIAPDSGWVRTSLNRLRSQEASTGSTSASAGSTSASAGSTSASARSTSVSAASLAAN
jgi:tetratricopeptide (TPR) repeat protein